MAFTDKTSELDLSKMDLVALKRLIDTASETFESRKHDELKTLVNGWVMKAEAIGYSFQEVIDELQSRLPAARKRAPRGSLPKEPKPYFMGTVYKNPNGPDKWVGGSKGRQPPWLRDLVESLEGEAKARKFAELAKK